MEFLLFLGLIIGIILLIVRRPKHSATPNDTVTNPSHFLRFLASYAARDDESHALLTAARVSDEYFMQTMQTLPAPRQLPVTQASAQPQPVPVLQPQKPSYTGVNALLYTASLFIVGGAALVISSNVTDVIKIVGLLLIAGGFYAAGLFVYQRYPRLQPAAIAFLGTGLAIIPIWGVALHTIGHLGGGVAWLVTSAVGLLAFTGALRLVRHDILGYFTLGFWLSLAGSVPAAVESPVIMTYVGLLIGGALIALIYRQVQRHELHQSSLVMSALTPIIAMAAAVGYSHVSLIQVVVLLAAGALYHALYGLIVKERDFRLWHRSWTRIDIVAAASLLAYEQSTSVRIASGVAIIGLIAVGAVASYQSRSRMHEQIWSATAQALIIWLVLLFHLQSSVAIFSLLASVALGAMLYQRTKQGWAAIAPAIAIAIIPVAFEAIVAWPFIAATLYGIIGVGAGVAILLLRAQPQLRLIVMTAAPLVTVAGFMHTLASAHFTLAGALLALVGALCGLNSYLKQRQELVHTSLGALAVGLLMILGQEIAFSLACTLTGVTLVGLAGLASWLLYQRQHTTWRWPYTALCWLIPSLALLGVVTERHDERLFAVSLGLAGALFLVGLQRLGLSRGGYELALYTATFFLQVAYGTLEQTYFLVYTHWWALAIMAPLLWRSHGNDERRTRLVFGLLLVTLPSAAWALDHGSGYSWLFLIEHAVLVAVGAVSRSRLTTLWGAVGASLAVAWFVRDYAFVSLFIIAATLVGIALMQLRKDPKPPVAP